MSTIKKTELIQQVINTAGLGPTDRKPSKLFDSIMPVIDVNPNHNRVANIVAATVDESTTGDKTLYTTPTNQDFYLCTAQCSSQGDNLNNNTNLRITAIINGARVSVVTQEHLSLQTGLNSAQMSFPVPIKIDRGTTILLNSNFSAGTMVYAGVITGFTVNNY